MASKQGAEMTERAAVAVKRAAVAACASVLSMAVWGCNSNNLQEPPPFDPRSMTRGDRYNSFAQRQHALGQLPTTREAYDPSRHQPASRPVTGETPQFVRMSLQEIMHRTAANNKEVRVAGYDPAIAETRVMENEGHYDPLFFTNLRYDKQNDRTPGTVIPDPSNPQRTITIDTENNNIYTIESGVKQYLQTGGQIQLSYQVQHSDYNPVRYTKNNYWDAQLKMQLTQPLLREFGYEINWARITVARNDQRVSILDFRKTLEDNTEELEKDYWLLYEAYQDVLISEHVLQNARELVAILWDQVINGGSATTVELAQGSSTVSQREGELERARAHLLDISDDIKRRMGDPDFDIAGPLAILPADAPSEVPVQMDLHDQIETAYANRLELGQQQLRENSAEVARQVAINGLFPKLDFVGSAALQGLDTTLDKAFKDQMGTGHMVYSLGLQLEVPIGNREAASIMQRANLQLLQAIASYQKLLNDISTDVTQAWREIDTSWKALISARQARFAAEEYLEGLDSRQAQGLQKLDVYFVQAKLDAQDRVANARRREANELSNYNTAISRLERSKGTILRYNNIMMEEDQYPWMIPNKK
jgi:outer membrane protein TolC